jgi:putative transcriptional regulator
MATGEDKHIVGLDQSALREKMLAAYVAGRLEPALELMVEAQGAICPAARMDLQIADAVTGAFFECEMAVDLGPNALERVLAAIDQSPASQAPRARQPQAAHAASGVLEEILRLPEPVRAKALEAIEAGGWSFAGPGIRALPLRVAGPSHAELLRIEPGWGAPRHTHNGAEFTLVLSGAFHDERGLYRPGEIAVAGPGVTHQPTAERGAVCYSLAVTDAPLEFTGALGMIQKLWRH